MNKISNQFASIEQVTDQYLTRKSTDAVTSSGVSFEDILKQKQDAKAGGTLKFSKHATMRLMDRNINLSEEQNERLETGVFKAGEKGIRESLVIVDSLAFIVNVPNRTVVLPKKAREVFQIKAGDTIMVLGDEAQGIALVKADDMIDFVQQALKMANQKDKN